MVQWQVKPKAKRKVIVPPFAKKVQEELALINYRAYETSVRNIERFIQDETPARKAKLIKIRKQLNKVLNEL